MHWLKLLSMTGLMIVYIALSKFNNYFADGSDHILIINLSSGFLLSVLLLKDWRTFWVLLLAGVLAHSWLGESVEVAVLKATATSLTWLGVSRWLSHIDPEIPLLANASSYLKFIFLAACVGGAIDALALTVISIAFELSFATDYWMLFRRLWMANILGVTLFSPLVLVLHSLTLDQLKLPHALTSLLYFLLALVLGQIGMFGLNYVGWALPADASWLFIAVLLIAAYTQTYIVSALVLCFALEGALLAQVNVGLFAPEWQLHQLNKYHFTLVLLSILSMIFTIRFKNFQQEIMALREHERFYRLITENIEDFIAVLDIRGARIYNTPSYARLFGNVENIKGTDCFKEIHPEDKEHIKDVFSRTVNTGKGEWTEFRFILADGSVRTMESRGSLVFGEGDKEPYVVVVSRDVTERKLIELNQRIAAIAFECQEGMIVTDAHRNILRVNQAFTEITGYTADEVMGKPLEMLRSTRHDAAFYNLINESIAYSGVWRGELWSRRKDGQEYPEQHTLNAVMNDKGEVTHYVVMLVDITERKLTEDKIKQFAFSDPLTQLANRRQLLDRLEHGIEQGKRDKKKIALLMLDLDRFKEVNDNLGHKAGDELLKQVADRLTSRLRSVDLIARWGGDEFIVLLEDIQKQGDVAKVAEGIIMDMNKPFNIGRYDDIKIGVSIGISLYPEHGNTPEMLREQADIALYKAKDNGRGCYAYFSEDLTLVTGSKSEG